MDVLNEDFCFLESKGKIIRKGGSDVPSGSILQIQQITNISCPKLDGPQKYESDRHMLKVTLSDGENSVHGLLSDHVPRLGQDTPPGTKVKITQNVQVRNQMFIISKSNCQVLGGDVPKLIEKWNFQRAMDVKKDWGSVGGISGGSDGAPLWRPFEQETVPMDVRTLRKMKAMDIVNEKKESNSEGTQSQFEAQRNEAISELMEKSVKQKWHKPNKHLVEKEIQIIMDEGYSYETAVEYMNRYKNPQKALKALKGHSNSNATKGTNNEERKDTRKKNLLKDPLEDDTPIPVEYQRPTKSISLFGFIAGQIGDEGSSAPENRNMSVDDTHTSFNSNRRGRGRRGEGRGQGGGGRRGFENRRGRGESLTSINDNPNYG